MWGGLFNRIKRRIYWILAVRIFQYGLVSLSRLAIYLNGIFRFNLIDGKKVCILRKAFALFHFPHFTCFISTRFRFSIIQFGRNFFFLQSGIKLIEFNLLPQFNLIISLNVRIQYALIEEIALLSLFYSAIDHNKCYLNKYKWNIILMFKKGKNVYQNYASEFGTCNSWILSFMIVYFFFLFDRQTQSHSDVSDDVFM